MHEWTRLRTRSPVRLPTSASGEYPLEAAVSRIFALGAIAPFRPAGLPVVPGSLLVAATMTAIVIPTAAPWAAVGGWLGRLLESERSRRVVSLVLAVVLAVSVVAIWR